MEWISVEDRLPTTAYGEVDVIFNIKRGCLDEPHVGCYLSRSARWYSSRWDEDFMTESDNGVVTHWMPLPEPPKEGE